MRHVAVGAILWAAGGCLSEQAFEDRYIETRCAEQAACSPIGDGGDCQDFDIPNADNCDFDRSAALDCLNGEWVCNLDNPGFEFTVPPIACDIVCQRAADVGGR
ncbi:MAG: hypothetical protein KTR31_15795 [Myxococcales bacterium]|nr:hypothetical protein [Myxococcales bacterium]